MNGGPCRILAQSHKIVIEEFFGAVHREVGGNIFRLKSDPGHCSGSLVNENGTMISHQESLALV